MHLKCKRIPIRKVQTSKYKENGTATPQFSRQRYIKHNLLLLIVIGSTYSLDVYALPQSATAVAGSTWVFNSGSDMLIRQTTHKAIINWQKFGIDPGESVRFQQPDASSITLNRVTGSEKSVIAGSLNANGRVFILNPNGILFGNSAQVTVGGLLASTLNMENESFLKGEYQLAKINGGISRSVSNAGTITTPADGGYIVMLSDQVQNDGNINVPFGHALLAAGSQAHLYFNGTSMVGYVVDSGTAAALVQNRGRISATGGKVSLIAKGINASDQVARAVVNNSGVIEATTLGGQPGFVELSSDMQTGRTLVSGKIDASSISAVRIRDGGEIETSGASVEIDRSANISTNGGVGKTGHWTINTKNSVIGSNATAISNDALSNVLSKSNITIVAHGGAEPDSAYISVNEKINSKGSNKLTLKSVGDIQIAAPITIDTGGLIVYADINGTSNGSVKFSGNGMIKANNGGPIDIYTNVADYYKNRGVYQNFVTTPYTLWMLVNDVSQLQKIQNNLSGNYAIGKDIDASETRSWNGGAGFSPIGYLYNDPFQGRLDGMNHVISDLYIDRPNTIGVGLFGLAGQYGSTSKGEIKNLGLVNAYVRGESSIGALVGVSFGSLNNVYATGNVKAEGSPSFNPSDDSYLRILESNLTVGGLVGSNSGTIKNAYSLVDVHGIRGFWGGD